MNILIQKSVASLLAVSFILSAFCAPLLVPRAEAAVANWNKGVSIQPRWDADFGSETLKRSLDNAKNAGVNYVAFVIPYYQSNIHSTDIVRGWNTPTDASLIAGINYAHSIGLKVSLKIHMESFDGQWRAFINPGDRAGWFTAYGNILMKYAQIGAAHGAEQMIVGSELISMATDNMNPTNTSRWKTMISNIRSIYGGTLTYSANWGGDDFTEEPPDIKFWDALDYIGLSAYYPLTQGGGTSVEAFKTSWNHWNMSKIKPLADQWGKPVLFTEVGYRSVNDSHNDPWNSWRGGWYDPQGQVNLYTALFSYWNDWAFMQGGFLWDWTSDPNAGGEGDTNYTPQRKPAEGVMRTWLLGNQAPNPTPTPPPSSGPVSFSTTGRATPSSVATNQPVRVETTVTSGTSGASNVVVDLEVHNAAGTKVHQQFFEGQNFTGNEAKSFATSYTPTAEGSYTAKLGVFNSTWSTAHFFGDIGSFTVGGTPPPPSPPSPPPSSGPVSMTANGNASPSTVAQGAPVALTASVRNGANAASGVNVDLEVHNAAGVKVFQRLFENQNFSANQMRDYSASWATAGTGSHTFKIGVFNSSWTTAHAWNDAAGTFSVSGGSSGGGGTTPPPSTPPPSASTGQVEIWWPTDGSRLSGTQPFKAIVPGRDISTYTMFWQVDGDRMNEMADSQEGFPHKESLVDLSAWKWKGAGPYTLTFTAQNPGGTINSKSVNIFTE